MMFGFNFGIIYVTSAISKKILFRKYHNNFLYIDTLFFRSLYL